MSKLWVGYRAFYSPISLGLNIVCAVENTMENGSNWRSGRKKGFCANVISIDWLHLRVARQSGFKDQLVFFEGFCLAIYTKPESPSHSRRRFSDFKSTYEDSIGRKSAIATLSRFRSPKLYFETLDLAKFSQSRYLPEYQRRG